VTLRPALSAMSEREINKRLRSLHSDFDFLLDANVISNELYDELTQRIPRRYNAKSPSATPSVAAVPVVAVAAPVTADVPSLTGKLEHTSISSGTKSPPPPPPPATPPPPAYGLAQVEALYNYASTDEGDLPLAIGERIAILEYVNNDWWRGESSSGQQGIFPSNYVRRIEVSDKGYPGDKAAVPYQYPGQYAPVYAQPQPQYQQPQQYQQPPPPQQQEEQKQPSKLSQFGKNYGKTFVNATAWGGGITLGADVINKIF